MHTSAFLLAILLRIHTIRGMRKQVGHLTKTLRAHRLHLLAISFWIALGFLTIAATNVRAQESIKQSISKALRAMPHEQAMASVCVIDIASGATVFSHNADRAMVPASAAKVFTMAASLAVLGPDFSFSTALATDGEHLYLIGDGDPGMGDEKLAAVEKKSIYAPFDAWADLLILNGLTNIRGDLIIDETIFDNERTHPDWEPNDLGKWFAAPVGGLNVNGNCLDITVSPGGSLGAPVRVSIQPENKLAEIVNRCRSGGNGKPILHHTAGTFNYKITGKCAKPWRFGAVAFPDPGLLTADTLRQVLRKKGISVNGRIRRERIRSRSGVLPPALWVLATHQTTLENVLRRTGRNSQNLFAECLFKRVGYEWSKRRGRDTPQGTWNSGRLAIEKTLKEAGIDQTGLVISDGSGLSRRNRGTARQFCQTIAWTQSLPGASMFRDSLATPGIDGSLRNRLKDIRGAVFAKTGTMRGVSALTGITKSSTGRMYAFAILFNGYRGPSTPYKQIQNTICRSIAR